MTMTELIFTMVVGIVVLALVMFPEFRKKLKVLCGGFLNIFVEDKAKTPEGARAIYQQAIEEAQDKYAKSSDILRKVAGRLTNEKKNLAQLKEELKKTEVACENFVKANQMKEAELYSEKRTELLEEIKRKETLVKELESAHTEATEIATHNEKTLRKLKQQSKNIVSEMEMKKQVAEMYDDLDDLKKLTATSKLLESVQDGYEDLSIKASGAKSIHENKVSTKLQRADEKAAKLNSDAYLKELQQKYQK